MKWPARARRHETSLGGRVCGDDRPRKFGADLVGSAADARADPGTDTARARRRAVPSRDRRLDHAADGPRQPACAAPMTRAAGSHSSTGAQSAARTPSARPGTLVAMPSAAGARLAPPRAFDGDGSGAVDLPAGDQPIGGQARVSPSRSRGCARRSPLVARPEAAIQRRKEPVADPALPGEKGVADAANRFRARRDGSSHPICSVRSRAAPAAPARSAPWP